MVLDGVGWTVHFIALVRILLVVILLVKDDVLAIQGFQDEPADKEVCNVFFFFWKY